MSIWYVAISQWKRLGRATVCHNEENQMVKEDVKDQGKRQMQVTRFMSSRCLNQLRVASKIMNKSVAA